MDDVTEEFPLGTQGPTPPVEVGAELALVKKTQRRWRSLVENAPEIILTIGLDRRIDFINRTEGSMTPRQVVGLHYQEFLQSHDRERVAALIEGVFRTGKPCSYETDARQPDGLRLGWFACRVGPVIHQGQVESVVIIASNITEGRRVDEELRTSREQLRRLTALQQSALENERRHIARELHDELGQMLTALKIDLAWMERRVKSEAVLGRIEAMTEIVDSTMGTVRRITSNLRPPLLDELGPQAALDWLAQEICGRAGLQYTLSSRLGKESLGEERSLTLFRVCQEALTNVVRHARAQRVDLVLTMEQNRVHLKISDDGIGISPDHKERSLGLLGLRERVERLGGTVTIGGSSDSGTTLEAFF